MIKLSAIARRVWFVVFVSALGATWSVRDLSAIEVTAPPTISGATNAPLSRVLNLSTDVPTRISFRVQGPGEQWLVESTELNTVHSIPLLGFAPDRQYTISHLALVAANGMDSQLGDQLQVTTDPLPADFPTLTVNVSKPTEMEPGYTLFSTGNGYTTAVDANGQVRWYTVGQSNDVRRQFNGRLLGRMSGGIREFDFLGNVWFSLAPSGNASAARLPATHEVNATVFHHDVTRLPNGNVLTIDRQETSVDNFPLSETDPNATGAANVRHDIILEISPADGSVVNRWDLLDMLDTSRIGYGTHNRPQFADWTHSNAVVYDARDDSIIVSVRNQEAMIKFSRGNGQLKWILGDPTRWQGEFADLLLTPQEIDFEWSYHAHAPMITENGDLLIHDNGTFRAVPYNAPLPDDENYTRSVIYEIDEQNMTISQVWEYGKEDDEVIFSASRGDSDWLSATDNVLTTYSDVRYIDGVEQDLQWSRIIEVSESGEEVFDLQVSRLGTEFTALNVYRSERIPSLYGPGIRVSDVPEPGSMGLCALAAAGLVACLRWT